MTEINYPKVVAKKKQIPVIVDFCVEESIEFNVKQQSFPNADWEVEVKIKDIKTAVLFGMFLRENKFEMEGIDQQRIKKPSGKKGEEKTTENIHKTESAEDIEKGKSKQVKPDSQEPTLI